VNLRTVITLFFLLTSLGFGEVTSPAAAEIKTEYIRVVEDGDAARLQTSIATLEKDGVRVDLIGAIHIADAAYYKTLNQTFTQYDSLLFEMVGGEKLTVGEKPKETAPEEEKSSLSGLRDVYAMVAKFLGLSGQSEVIDYQAKNFVHADLSMAEFTEKQKQRNESLLGLALKAGAAPAATKTKQPDGTRLMAAMLMGNSNLMKLELIHTLGQGDDQISMFAGDTVIVTDRNERACILQGPGVKGLRRAIMLAACPGRDALFTLLAPLLQVAGQHARKRISQFPSGQPFDDARNLAEDAPRRIFVGE
jgi:hypothetical protein